MGLEVPKPARAQEAPAMRSGPPATVWSGVSRLPDPSVTSWTLTAAHTSWDLEL